MTPEEMVARLLYRDGLMLVIDKPAGFAVHKGPNGGGSLEDHFGALRFGLPRSPALAHRLDRDTSGCLVLGRHRKALATLGRLFRDGRIRKTYWAVVEGGPDEPEGRVELALGRRDETRGWWMKPDPHGQPAVTTWKVMGRAAAGGSGDVAATAAQAAHGEDRARGTATRSSREPRLAWLALQPLTGRTHQLRVHCAAMGWPILGDTIYGTRPAPAARHQEGLPQGLPGADGPALLLHAREIVVPLYKNKEPICVTAPVPLHMQEQLYACGWQGEIFTLVE